MLEAKKETGSCDGAGEPAYTEQLSTSASPGPNTAQHLPDVTYQGDALLPGVFEVRLALTRSSQCY